jgi:2-polyprenyl-3-methyl-5-hydroxy-6-metoxy-1,4-benzoquinol methylase/glycosyltransferase involved in cell wall biosynthesis
MIVRNEEAQLRACLESVRPHVQEIVVVDTGSTDSTPKIALEFADIFTTYSECNDPETGLITSFSVAREKSFSLATRPWLFWIDGDDELIGGEHLKTITDEAPPGPCIYAMPYDYDPTCLQYRERLLRPRERFKWTGPVHECLTLIDPGSIRSVADDRVKIVHRRKPEKPSEPQRNLRILRKLYADEGERDARTLFYLGRELSYVPGEIEEALKLLERYVELSGWDDERVLACMRISELYLCKNMHDRAIEWGFKAVSLNETWGEPYFAIARAYSNKAHVTQAIRDWQRCVHYAMTGLNLPPTKTVLFVNPLEREVDIHRYLNIALNRLGQVEAALGSVQTALQRVPGDGNLELNRKIYENYLARRQFEAALRVFIQNDVCPKQMAETALACIDGRAQSFVVGAPGTPSPPGSLPQGILAGAPVIAGAEYKRPAGYPKNVTVKDFPVACPGPHSQAWVIPVHPTVLDDLPLVMTDAQVEALTLALWKEYVLHDEMLSAESLLQNAPYRVRHSLLVQRALHDTRATMAWMDDAALEQSTNAPADPEVECGVPLPGPLSGQLLGRSELVLSRLQPTDRILDFGCSDGSIANRWALAGYDVTGVDLCESSVRLARKKAEEFKTGARFVCSKFSEIDIEAIPELSDIDDRPFDVVTSTDTYEHVRDGVGDIIAPARLMLGDNPKGRMILVTPYGAWMRGAYVPWAHPWRWADEQGKAWNAPLPRAHLVAPTPWTVAEHFRSDGWWVKDSYAVMCDVWDVPGQGNVVCEAWLSPPESYCDGMADDARQRLDVVFSTGQAWQEWNPEIMRTKGIGGSETAVVEMGKRLAAKGHRVRVYGSCGAHGEGIYDGVEYYQHDKIALETLRPPADVLVAWRDTSLLLSAAAKVKLLWVHDVFAQGSGKYLLQADRVLALSEWHKQNICAHHGLSPDHVHVTRNGIDLTRFDVNPYDTERILVGRDPHKAIYSSSPDRGLESLVQMWPRIRTQVPDATLHVFYGFELWKACALPGSPLQARITQLEANIAALAGQGVVMRGKVDQKTLAKEMLSAGVWTYPTWFAETSCITAMEAQAAGLRIVTSPIAALPETAKGAAIFIEGDWLSAVYQEKFVAATVSAMTTPRDPGFRDIATRFSWDGVATEWEALFRSELARKTAQPLAPYSGARTFVREGRTSP